MVHGFFLKKWVKTGLFLFISFLFSLQFQYKIGKSIDGVLGIRTWGRRMVGADETTELWRPPENDSCLIGIRNDLILTQIFWYWKPLPTATTTTTYLT